MAARVWKAGVLKTPQCRPKPRLGLKPAKEAIVRQLVNLHTRKYKAKERLKQYSKGSASNAELTPTYLARMKASDDLGTSVQMMKELKKEMKRRGMRF